MRFWLLVALVIVGSTGNAIAIAPDRIRGELERLARDYQNDPNRLDIVFGMRIDGVDWTIASGNGRVSVSEGRPGDSTWTLVCEADIFLRIAGGDLSALTAMAQARSTDPTLVKLDIPEGFTLDEAAQQDFLSVLFHFFITGQPEIVPLGIEHARVVHGAHAIPVYYGPHLRTGWYAIGHGQHINEDPKDQVNDFPSIFIFIQAGTAQAKIGGKHVDLKDNIAIFVPAGVTHEFWNPGDDMGQFIILMFGEGA